MSNPNTTARFPTHLPKNVGSPGLPVPTVKISTPAILATNTATADEPSRYAAIADAITAMISLVIKTPMPVSQPRQHAPTPRQCTPLQSRNQQKPSTLYRRHSCSSRTHERIKNRLIRKRVKINQPPWQLYRNGAGCFARFADVGGKLQVLFVCSKKSSRSIVASRPSTRLRPNGGF